MRVVKYFSTILAMSLLTTFATSAQVKNSNDNNPNIKNAVQIIQKTDYSGVTNDAKIMKALDLMDGTAAEWSKKAILGKNLSKLPIKVEFKDLSTISSAYSTFDALGWKVGDQLYIYLNSKHRNAPAEALASLLSHEAIHQDEYSSIEEETYGWSYEANVWMQMKKLNPELSKLNPNVYPLVYRMNTLENMYKGASYTESEIRQAVSSNPGYRNLPSTSPGFEVVSNKFTKRVN